MNRPAPRLPLLRVAAAALLSALPSRAQLNLGSHDVPQEEIDAYMAPFYRLVAAGLGSGRFFPEGGTAGWHLGFQGAAVPVPGGEPFEDAALSVLPLFRLEGGARFRGLGLMGRGLAWSDPRMGALSTFGGGLSAGRGFPVRGLSGPAGPGIAFAALVVGWDRLVFSSEYTYRYEGTVLGLFGQDIPGSYTLTENLTGAGARAALGWGPWTLRAEALLEWTSGRFRYAYLHPQSGNRSRVASDLEQAGFRAGAGASWRGFRVQADWRDFPCLSAGWSYTR